MEYYRRADLCSLFCEYSLYREFAMPIKLFEYMEKEKPIIATINTAAGDFVTENDIGWAIDYDEDMLEKLL